MKNLRETDLNIEVAPYGPRVKEPYEWTPERALVEAKDAGFQTALLSRMPFARLLRQSRMRREYAQRVALYRMMTADRRHEETIRTLLEAHGAPLSPSQTRPAVPTQRQPETGLRESPASPARHLVQMEWPGYQSYVEQVSQMRASQDSVFVDQTIRALACFTWAIALILLALAYLSDHLR